MMLTSAARKTVIHKFLQQHFGGLKVPTVEILHILTVDHLNDATGAGNAGGELVTTSRHVARENTGQKGLVCFGRPAGRVQVVSSGVVRVDG